MWDSINLTFIAAGNWQLAAGRFLPGESGIFRNEIKNTSQLVVAIKASGQEPKANSDSLIDSHNGKLFYPIRFVIEPNFSISLV